jgi:hypothetical protein
MTRTDTVMDERRKKVGREGASIVARTKAASTNS